MSASIRPASIGALARGCRCTYEFAHRPAGATFELVVRHTCPLHGRGDFQTPEGVPLSLGSVQPRPRVERGAAA